MVRKQKIIKNPTPIAAASEETNAGRRDQERSSNADVSEQKNINFF